MIAIKVPLASIINVPGGVAGIDSNGFLTTPHIGFQSASSHQELQEALSYGGSVYLSKDWVGDGGQFEISKSIHVFGNGATLKDVLITASSEAVGANVVIENVRFTTEVTSGTLPPYVFNPRNLGRITLRNCVFDNVMVYIATTDQSARYGMVVEGCTFIADWSSFAYNSQQADCLTVLGYQGVSIKNNVFIGHNINRFLKVSVGLTSPLTPPGNPVPAMMPRGIEVHGNIFLGTGAGKQLIDCYTGTVDFIFSSNFVKLAGFTAGVENKTGYAYTTAGVATSHKVINNHFEMNVVAVQFQGGWSATGWAQNSYDNILVEGNTFNATTHSSGTVSVRFMNSAIIKANQFACVGTIANKTHIDVSSCEDILIAGNTINGGTSTVSIATANAQGETFNGQPKNVSFVNNICREFNLNGAMMVKDCSAISSLVISNNSAFTTQESEAITATFWIRSTIARNVVCQGNASQHTANESKETIASTLSTISRFVNANNSWSVTP